MPHKLFISFATGDETYAKELNDSLTKLENIEVYVPEWIENGKLDFKLKVMEGLDTCEVVIVLITFNSTNTIWLNQEIGYATAKKIPIIPIIEQGIDVRGFLEGNDYFVFKRGNFIYNINEITIKLQSILHQ